MSLDGLLVFAAVFSIACASPGPAIVALVARVIGKGVRGTPYFCLGLLLGDLVWLTCAVFGLVALAEVFHPLFVAIKYLGAAYLLYLGWKLWTAPAVSPWGGEPRLDADVQQFMGVLGGFALTLGNPKTMLFYLALLPTVIDLPAIGWVGFTELACVVVVIYGLVLVGYVVFAARSRGMIRNARAMRVVHRIGGTIMTGAAIAVVARD